jgi:ascorbate-specific PTS system EIIC-type component UlaA
VFTSKSYKQYATVAIKLGEEDKSQHDHTSLGSLGAVLKDQNVALEVLCQYIVHCLVALGMSLIDTRQVVNVLNVRFSGSP